LADGSVTGVKLSNNALLAGANVDIVRRGNGSWEISAAVGGGGGLTQVASDATLSGDGTAGSPLQLADGAVTGVKIADGSVTGAKLASSLDISGAVRAAFVQGQSSNGLLGYLGGSYAVYGEHPSGTFGYIGGNGYAVYGEKGSTRGILGLGNYGAYGQHTGSSNAGYLGSSQYAVWGKSISGHAGYFDGKVHVTGTLSKGGGSFKIDHPLDPAGKYLSHSFVESPDMKNVYDGTVITDANGEAIVTLPDYFDALNRDFRYQLTTIGGFAPVYVAEEIAGNQFRIAGGEAGMKVSWQVTGIRQDAWAEENRIVVEEVKSAKEQGFYLHPTLFGQPPQRSVEWARDPVMMRELQEMSAESETEPVSRPRQQ
jgi:hypothetical protein